MEMRWLGESSWQLMLEIAFNRRGDAYHVFIYISREFTNQQSNFLFSKPDTIT